MIIKLKYRPEKKDFDAFVAGLEKEGLAVHEIDGERFTVLGLTGDTSKLDADRIRALDFVSGVKRIQEPYKEASRSFHPSDTVIDISGKGIGAGNFRVIAGPCSVESEEQLCGIAKAVKASGADFLRGGAFKPRTSPYSFQGLRKEGLRILLEAKKLTGLPVVTEAMDISQLELFDDIDVIQVGARNMQNFELLKELGKLRKPILLKRGLSSTLQELLMSAEYIMAGGNDRIILCERGIRTFETTTKNTLGLASVPLLKKMTHLPVIVDPSHATGNAALVKPMSMAATAAGADGLMIEVHNDPANALCDGPQALDPAAFDDTLKAVKQILPFAYRD
ncbi:MAG: 3-deoxy-7-phosphoheptulonate synthase [Clostridia bacterium]|nr:3-deoxy-7-phosphoheptulonate synthase [Clostridia bacterium]